MVGGHDLEAALGTEQARVLAGGLEVVAVHHELGTEAQHCRVLVRAVAIGNDDRDSDPRRSPRKGKALAVVATGGGHDPAHRAIPSAKALGVHDAHREP